MMPTLYFFMGIYCAQWQPVASPLSKGKNQTTVTSLLRPSHASSRRETKSWKLWPRSVEGPRRGFFSSSAYDSDRSVSPHRDVALAESKTFRSLPDKYSTARSPDSKHPGSFHTASRFVRPRLSHLSIFRNELPAVIEPHDRPEIERHIVTATLNKSCAAARIRMGPETNNTVVRKLRASNGEKTST